MSKNPFPLDKNQLLDAYRTGAGVDWADYGPDVVEAQEAINRPQFHHHVGEWIAAMPDIHARLAMGRGRVADIACGTGWSTISIARRYPGIEVTGIDIDAGDGPCRRGRPDRSRDVPLRGRRRCRRRRAIRPRHDLRSRP